MPIKGVQLLPPRVEIKDALNLYKKVADIKTLIGQLNSELNHSLINSEIMQILSLQESVQSTRIEGTQVTFADMIEQATQEHKSKEVIEVINYRKALQRGIDLLKDGHPISSKMIQELHSILMSGEARGTTSSAGEFRKIQNFLGPDNNIENAVYVPVSAEKISEYMTNLEYYINGEKHLSFIDYNGENVGYEILDENVDPLIKTAIIHAQFESIHPFLDGNGRLGRILIILCFMMDDLIDQPVFFISEELERERLRYYNRLNATRGDNPDWYSWIDFFLSASQRMAKNLLQKLEDIDKLATNGLGIINSENSTIHKIWYYTFSNPFCTVREVAEHLKITPQTARKHLKYLADRGLLELDQSKKRNQLFVNYDLLSILN